MSVGLGPGVELKMKLQQLEGPLSARQIRRPISTSAKLRGPRKHFRGVGVEGG